MIRFGATYPQQTTFAMALILEPDQGHENERAVSALGANSRRLELKHALIKHIHKKYTLHRQRTQYTAVQSTYYTIDRKGVQIEVRFF